MTSADSLRQVLLRSSHSVRKASQGKSTIFPVIYPPHLHREFRIAWGFSLCCNLTHSHMPDAVPVRRTNGLPRASFRFHLTMDTLAFGYALGAIPCARDFHPLDCAHAWHTSGRSPWIISTGVLPHHVAYGSRTTRLRAVIGVTSVLSVLLLASPVPFTYLSRQLCSAEFSFGGAPVWSF